MRQKIDLPGLYADARQGLPETISGQAPLPVPDACPVTLDELLDNWTSSGDLSPHDLAEYERLKGLERSSQVTKEKIAGDVKATKEPLDFASVEEAEAY